MTEILERVSMPSPDVLEQLRQDYERDGAACVRGAIPAYWLDRLAEGTERMMNSDGMGLEFNRKGDGRFFASVFTYMRLPEYQEFLFQSGIAALIGAIMESRQVRFFYDQPLIKEPGTPKRTPWHHDSAYWPCTGWQVMSAWVPLDAGSPETGVVSYVKGSHRWQAYYPPEDWSEQGSSFREFSPDANMGQEVLPENPGPGATGRVPRTIADIRDHPENYEFVTWNVEPGDFLIHHMHTVHGAPGNISQTQRRRAIALRFFGDDARWSEERPHFMRTFRRADPNFPYPQHQDGDLITDPVFPLLYDAHAA